MKTLFKNANVYTKNGFEVKDFTIDGNKLHVLDSLSATSFDNVIDCTNKYIVPGFVDVHVHLREPGFFYKETIKTGSMAAAKGGYTTVFTMPNLKPAPSTYENLKIQLDIIEKDASVRVIPYGTITMDQSGHGELAKMEEMNDYVCAFTDDGKGVQAKELMREAMYKAKALDKAIVAHCEDESLIHGGYIHDGEYAKLHGHNGICSASEWVQIERDARLVEEIGVKYHVCHVSAKESVDVIRKAKARGVNITAETGPHYLVLTDMDLKEDGKFKMNPPLRGQADKEALIEGIIDGTIDMIATDHAPHSKEEKSKGLKDSAFGIVGLETAFAILNTYLIKEGIISLEKLIELMAINPRKRFDLPLVYIEDGYVADFTILDLDAKNKIDVNDFVSMGKATPFEGYDVYGEILQTYVDGRLVYNKL